MTRKPRIAIVGTNGIPASYGGYETLTEQLTRSLSDEYDFVVYCGKKNSKELKEYNGVKLRRYNINANGWQSIVYDIVSLLDARKYADVILYLGPSAGIFLPLIRLRNSKLITNYGGLNEWERPKYGKLGCLWIKAGYKRSGKKSDINIADNYQLQASLDKTFGINSVIVRYGGDHAKGEVVTTDLMNKYPFLGTNYYVSVSRAQPDNMLHIVLEAFKQMPESNLVMVSNWSVSQYGIELKNQYRGRYPNITILDAVYDVVEINAIRSNAKGYIHSHSYCGTAPSLTEAMSLGLPVISYDVPTNRETTKNGAFYFKDSSDLIKKIASLNNNDICDCGARMKEIALEEYTWRKISSEYSKLFNVGVL